MPAPLARLMLPPVVPVPLIWSPAVKVMSPPDPVSPAPTLRVIDPPTPPVAWPVVIAREPEMPSLAVPVWIVTRPLTPAVPALAVEGAALALALRPLALVVLAAVGAVATIAQRGAVKRADVHGDRLLAALRLLPALDGLLHVVVRLVVLRGERQVLPRLLGREVRDGSKPQLICAPF